ncbi:MAG: hypothetical protein WDM85_14960 [Caulobacteraceae bacterium]
MVHKLILPLTIGCLTAVATLAAAQPQGGQISVRRAFYGSSEAGLSNRIDVTPQVSRQCDGKAACSFECSAQALKVYNRTQITRRPARFRFTAAPRR